MRLLKTFCPNSTGWQGSELESDRAPSVLRWRRPRLGLRLYSPQHKSRMLSARTRSEEHTSELQSQSNLVCRLLLEKKKPHIKYIGHLIRMFRNTMRGCLARPHLVLFSIVCRGPHRS